MGDNIESKYGSELYSVLFHFNQYTNCWNCFSTNEKREYFNGNHTNIGRGDSIEEAFTKYQNKEDEEN